MCCDLTDPPYDLKWANSNSLYNFHCFNPCHSQSSDHRDVSLHAPSWVPNLSSDFKFRLQLRIPCCKSFRVNSISISSVLPRKDFSLNEIIHEINNLLKNMCNFNSLKFIYYNNIDLNMLCRDNLHLRPVGTFLLTKNFADVFNVAD